MKIEMSLFEEKNTQNQQRIISKSDLTLKRAILSGKQDSFGSCSNLCKTDSLLDLFQKPKAHPLPF